MRAALAEARKGIGQTSPNPAVGAVLVVGEKIVARGHHRGAGLPHAEVECLSGLKGPLMPGATLYVTLEPCSTPGKTGPCTDVILRAAVKTVVVGATDPNPHHLGRGLAILEEAGTNVRAGVLADECAAINEPFAKWIQTGRPFVTAKCGMSLDGRLTRPPQEGRWLTSVAARRRANRLRAEVDAILVGAETIRADDPQLTVRGVRGARQPWRVILTRSGNLPKNARVFTDRFADRTLVFRDRPLPDVLTELGAKEITSVLIEGGGDVLGQALDAQLIDRVQIYLAPLFTGGPAVAFPGGGAGATIDALHLQNVSYEKIAGDIFVSGKTAHPASNSE